MFFRKSLIAESENKRLELFQVHPLLESVEAVEPQGRLLLDVSVRPPSSSGKLNQGLKYNGISRYALNWVVKNPISLGSGVVGVGAWKV
jgi:hypothetical protein